MQTCVRVQDAVYFLDRTAEGGPVFEPTEHNVVPLPGTLPDQVGV